MGPYPGEVRPVAETQSDSKYKLRGHKRRRLIRDLAEGALTQSELAAKYEVRQPAISQFKKREKDAIERARVSIEDTFQDLWIAQKEQRLAEYEADVEQINEHLSQNGLDKDVMRVKHTALRNSAEEMGHLTQRFDLNAKATVRYEVAGVDVDELT